MTVESLGTRLDEYMNYILEFTSVESQSKMCNQWEEEEWESVYENQRKRNGTE